VTEKNSWELAAAAALPGANLIDGPWGIPHAKTLVIETKTSGLPPTLPFDNAGVVILQFEGQNLRGWYTRRFALRAWDGVSLYVEQFAGCRLTVLGNTLAGFNLVAVVSDGDEASSQPALLYTETLVAGAGVVPWGAIQMMSAAADAGFRWQLDATVIPVAIVAGTLVEVMGVRYLPSVFPFSAVWRIRP
jgi:hypothetical protein